MASSELDTYLLNLKAEIDNVLADDEDATVLSRSGEVRESCLICNKCCEGYHVAVGSCV